jgi:hypothetical protein
MPTLGDGDNDVEQYYRDFDNYCRVVSPANQLSADDRLRLFGGAMKAKKKAFDSLFQEASDAGTLPCGSRGGA